MTTTISAADNPDLLNAYAAAALAQPDVENDVDESSLELPDTHVRLPGGYITEDFDVEYDAEVRELNGADEEAIAKTPNLGRALITILERGTVKVGEEKATKKLLDGMLSGDRDMLLLAIRRATFGDELTFKWVCQHCVEESDFDINLKEDIPIKTLDEASDRMFTVECRVGDVQVTLPTGDIQRDLMTGPDRTMAELNTVLLAGCIQSINGVPVMGVQDVKRLGILDRETITTEISNRNPGPKLADVTKQCSACGEEASVPLNMSALFRF
jgi:hypothetical protein